MLSISHALLNAQECEIPLIPYIRDRIDPLPEETRSYLETKLTQMVTENGISAGAGYGQFYLVSRFTLLTKDIVSGSPTMISQRISMSLSIVDYFGEKVIASTNFEFTATGSNENKSFINGIRSISPANPKIQNFIRSGKEKMLNYYDSNYGTIIKKAQTLAETKQYEEALFHLASIPECSKGYHAAVDESFFIYKTYVDYQCLRNLQQARSIWAASPNASGASAAGAYLVRIEPDAGCYSDAVALYNEIKSSVKEQWDFEFKNYDARALERERINAFREVGIAYGKGQQPSTTILERLH
jgi:hypothetical protein